LSVFGRIQGAKTALSAMTGEVLGVINIVSNIMFAPRDFVQAFFNTTASIVGSIQQIKTVPPRMDREAIQAVQ
jgi:uncharacterized membrane protein